MDQPHVAPIPGCQEYVVGLMRGVIVSHCDTPVAAFPPRFEMTLYKCYDVFLAVTPLGSYGNREPPWESALSDELLQADVHRAVFFAFEHAFDIWHVPLRDFGDTRKCGEVRGPSRPHVCTSFHHGNGGSFNRQSELVLGPRLIVMERGLVKVQDKRVVSEHAFDEQPNSI